MQAHSHFLFSFLSRSLNLSLPLSALPSSYFSFLLSTISPEGNETETETETEDENENEHTKRRRELKTNEAPKPPPPTSLVPPHLNSAISDTVQSLQDGR